MTDANGNAVVATAATATRADAGGSAGPGLKWINAGPDEGALHALLERVAERLPREQIDVLWIFPTRVAAGVESTVIVVAGFDADAERRSVATAHFKVTRDKRGRATVTLQMQEHGTAPVGATQRVVDGVVRRLGDEVGSQSPRREEIAGSPTTWWDLYRELGGVAADVGPAEQEAPVSSSDTETEGQMSPSEQETEGQSPSPETEGQSGVGAGEAERPLEDDGAETPPHGDPLLEPATEPASQDRPAGEDVREGREPAL